MHYDHEKGIKHLVGLFSKITVLILSVLLFLFGIYLAVDWFAPEIFSDSIEGKQALEEKVKNEQPDENQPELFIPSLGLEAEIVEKKADDKIQITKNDKQITLSGQERSLGITPAETLQRSVLALLKDIKTGAKIYVDIGNQRVAYEVTDIKNQVSPNNGFTGELAILALSGDALTATTFVSAKEIGVINF
ncbi:MAG: hypothetical protein LBL08_01650 [Candidatus Nomurabacteria bacterium]|jgi:hypothetical protein|nr:hypothetical protein [Candidatus Nomurabacteria bacterium]